MAYIHWNVSPELFQLGPLVVRWYGLMFALLFLFGYRIVRYQFITEGRDPKGLDNLLVYVVLGTVIGARLGHVLFYEPAYYYRHPVEALFVWKGGLASHGGATGVLLALWLYCRRHPEISYLWLLDRISVPAALAAAMIRLGNLFNSEILGTPSDVPWAFVFVRTDQLPRHPVQLYEALAYLALFLVLWKIYRTRLGQTPRGMLLGLLLIGVFTARFFLEFLKERQADYEQAFVLSVGQILSIPFVLAGVALWWRSLTTFQNNLPAGSERVTSMPHHLDGKK